MRVSLVGMGLLLMVNGIALAAIKIGRSNYSMALPLVSILGGIVILWANDFGRSRVTVTSSEIKTRTVLKRSAQIDEIQSLDILHSGLSEPECTMPTVLLKNGKSFSLQPLEWSEQIGSEQLGWTIHRQKEIVHEIRRLLGVTAHD